MTTTPQNPYLRDAVLTATPEQLQLMLYDGCIRYALQARDAIEQKNYDVSYDRLTRAQNIISEMRSGLRHEVNPELCERVAAVYGFLHRKLLDANIHRDVSMIDDALRVLRIERETWQILVNKVNRIRDCADDDTSASATHDSSGDQPTVSFQAEG
ncbi:MAG: flagellar export chaperone FliS [Planctomycetes bacterium]|nr:flagellar export chaperone FliS [Planctomycetota bacterium]